MEIYIKSLASTAAKFQFVCLEELVAVASTGGLEEARGRIVVSSAYTEPFRYCIILGVGYLSATYAPLLLQCVCCSRSYTAGLGTYSVAFVLLGYIENAV